MMIQPGPKTTNGATRAARNTPLSRFYKLDWTSRPSRFLPHGLTGAISLMFGAYLVVCSLMGDIRPYQTQQMHNNNNNNTNVAWLFPSWSFMGFFLTMFASGVAGFWMAPHAQAHLRFLFRFLGLELCFITYFSLRLLPSFAASVGPTMAVRGLDVSMAMGMIVLILYGIQSMASLVVKGKVPMAQGLSSALAFLSLLTLTAYPLHLAYQGQEWYDCVHEEFPLFGVSTTAYAYVTAIVFFSIVAFSASLYIRKIIGTTGIVIAFLSVAACLVASVLMMEFYFPFVSVQRLYLPCPKPDYNSIHFTLLEQSLDLSVISQAVWTYMGFTFQEPREYFRHWVDNQSLQYWSTESR